MACSSSLSSSRLHDLFRECRSSSTSATCSLTMFTGYYCQYNACVVICMAPASDVLPSGPVCGRVSTAKDRALIPARSLTTLV